MPGEGARQAREAGQKGSAVSKQDLANRKACDRLESMIYANGGVWAKVKHSNGKTYGITKLGIASYERLRHDAFTITLGDDVIQRNVTFEQAVEFLLNPNQ